MMPRGVSLKCVRTRSDDLVVGDAAGAGRVDEHGDGIGDADRVRELHERLLGKAGRDDVLGDVARHVARGAIDLRGILAGERAAAVRRGAAVGVDDDLAAGDAGVAVRAAGDEAARRIHVDLGVRVHHLAGDDLVDDPLGEVFGDRRVRRGRAVLRGDDDGVDADGTAAVVLDGHLRLAVGPEVIELTAAARLGQAAHELVREHDRQRHQLGRLGAGVAEHQALVAGAARVHALADVARLLVNRREDGARLVVEAELRARVADVFDDLRGRPSGSRRSSSW